ncbi:uncharacterized protein LOC62_03G004269 [Vanrija pseudolonga]|uniref:Uncharacterized protein n=1 Tax=Vanrija pseudolonga TaxID=143232 RepID=A0AAF1BK77_9TREE|nr:hypothetical protein LOC62_03G004269 [Vanrija pseudolonga]
MAPVTIPTKFTVANHNQNDFKGSADLPFSPQIATSEREYIGGELQGKVTTVYTMFKYSNHANKDDGSFIGIQIFTGTLQGKKGSFASHITGTKVDGVVTSKFTIVPESSTDELKGIKGHGSYAIADANALAARAKAEPDFKIVVHGELTFEL